MKTKSNSGYRTMAEGTKNVLLKLALKFEEMEADAPANDLHADMKNCVVILKKVADNVALFLQAHEPSVLDVIDDSQEKKLIVNGSMNIGDPWAKKGFVKMGEVQNAAFVPDMHLNMDTGEKDKSAVVVHDPVNKTTIFDFKSTLDPKAMQEFVQKIIADGVTESGVPPKGLFNGQTEWLFDPSDYTDKHGSQTLKLKMAIAVALKKVSLEGLVYVGSLSALLKGAGTDLVEVWTKKPHAHVADVTWKGGMILLGLV